MQQKQAACEEQLLKEVQGLHELGGAGSQRVTWVGWEHRYIG